MIVSKNFLYLTRVDSRVFPEKEIYKLIQVLKTIIVCVLRDVFLNRLKNNQVCISQHTLSKTCTLVERDIFKISLRYVSSILLAFWF